MKSSTMTITELSVKGNHLLQRPRATSLLANEKSMLQFQLDLRIDNPRCNSREWETGLY
jgi:hypothetical protein